MKSYLLSTLLLTSTVSLHSCERQINKTASVPIAPTHSEKVAEQPSQLKDQTPKGMVHITGTTYTRGSDKAQENGTVYHEEGPVHKVTVSSFYIDQTEVTNAQFKKFVDATGYITFAEKGLTKKDFPHAPPAMLKPGASVFAPPKQLEGVNPHRANPQSWWSFTENANWKQPTGPGSTIKDKMDHPVVCVNHNDAEAYAKWAGKRLPTEAEWELAARGGLDHKTYAWGDKRFPQGPTKKWMTNCFQGKFPATNTKEDGHLYSAPVKSFPANGFGLYDMSGNVWEMCSDLFHPDYYKEFVKAPVANPKGPTKGITEFEMTQWRRYRTIQQTNPQPHPLTILRVTKGGSFLCHVEYCLRYRPAARHQTEMLTPTNHTGFRCVQDLQQK